MLQFCGQKKHTLVVTRHNFLILVLLSGYFYLYPTLCQKKDKNKSRYHNCACSRCVLVVWCIFIYPLETPMLDGCIQNGCDVSIDNYCVFPLVSRMI